ncbi:MAG: peptidylprolyl isomerase [Steroidobacteraceae bacterium]
MKNLKFLALLPLAALALLAGCQQKGASSSVTASSTASSTANASASVAVVNGLPISRSFYDFYVKRISGGHAPSDLTAAQRDQALDSLIRAQLVAQLAQKDGDTHDPDTQNLIELSRLDVLEQVVSQQYLKGRKPTEEQLRTEYESQVAKMPQTEYHARHILVATKPFAEMIIKQLEHGAKFADLAKRDSVDSSKTNGGDLGWFTTTNMVKPFADAVVALKPGEFTHQPVHTKYGWHVIQLIDTRPLTPPTFQSVQQRLTQILESRQFTSYVDGLVKKAKIKKSL